MRLLVLGSENGWHTRDLRRAAGQSQLIASAGYHELNVGMGSLRSSNSLDVSQFRVGSIELSDFDAVFVRAMPSASLEQVVFRMDCLSQLADQLRIPVINPARAIEISVDKYLSLEKIRAAGINVPRTHVSQSTNRAVEFFLGADCDSVVKPIFGSQGRNIVRVTDQSEARQLFDSLVASGKVIFQQEYIEHGDSDIRLLVIGARVFGMRRCRPGHWITNVSQGAHALVHDPTAEEIELARRASAGVGALVAGVDVVYDREHRPWVIEINACPSWQAISQVNSSDIGAEILRVIASSQ